MSEQPQVPVPQDANEHDALRDATTYAASVGSLNPFDEDKMARLVGNGYNDSIGIRAPNPDGSTSFVSVHTPDTDDRGRHTKSAYYNLGSTFRQTPGAADTVRAFAKQLAHPSHGGVGIVHRHDAGEDTYTTLTGERAERARQILSARVARAVGDRATELAKQKIEGYKPAA